MIPAGADAYAEFTRVRAAVADARYPERVEYAVVVSGKDGSQVRADRYRARYYTGSGELRVQTITAAEIANPPHPHGFNLVLSMTLSGGRGGGTETTSTKNLAPSKAIEDLLGVPFLTPDYSFGIARPLQRAEATPAPSSTGLKTIAVVSAPQHDYAVTSAGDETIAGVATDHLKLRPLHDPNRYRLRELWIDPSTMLPRRAIVARNFTVAPEDTVPWQIDFAVVDGGLYISTETALQTLHEAHARFVKNATVTFDYKPAEGSVPAIALDPGDGFRSLIEP
jgi:MucB/RseB N-terminal domain